MSSKQPQTENLTTIFAKEILTGNWDINNVPNIIKESVDKKIEELKIRKEGKE